MNTWTAWLIAIELVVAAWFLSRLVSFAWSKLRFYVRVKVRAWDGYPFWPAQMKFEWHRQEFCRHIKAGRLRLAELHSRLEDEAWVDLCKELAWTRFLSEIRAMIESWEHQMRS